MSLFKLKAKLRTQREIAESLLIPESSEEDKGKGRIAMTIIEDICGVFKMDLDEDTYRIPCFWDMAGFVEVSAKSLEEAKEKAAEAPLTDGDYIPGSFQVDEQMIEHMLDNDGLPPYKGE